MTVGVYGLGRFGAFWAKCLSSRFDVKGYSRSSHRIAPEPVVRVSEDDVLACDAVFLCVAISAMQEVLERIASRIPPGSVVLDTCSVKVEPVRLMKEILPTEIAIIGTHPMFGPDSASSGIAGLPICFCPVRSSESLSTFWRSEFASMGLAVHDRTPDSHDREAAYTQGVTHFIGRVLDNLGLEKSEIGTLGYSKLLEIIEQTCNDPMQLFLDLQRTNPYTTEMRERFSHALNHVRDDLEDLRSPS